MEKIIWDQGFSVGIQELDKQHQKLIQMINQLIETHDTIDVRSETVSDTLTSMLKYTQYHFDAEEKLMLEYDYPQYQAHKEQHLKFVRRTAELAMDTVLQKGSVPEEILLYLRNWWTAHILQEDMQYKTFFKQKMLSE